MTAAGMAWFKKKPDPISDRARVLSDEIAALESQIKQLDSKLQNRRDQPRLRAPALPGSGSASPAPGEVVSSAPSTPAVDDPVFENVDHDRLDPPAEAATTPDHYNELGVRKYDLAAFFRRFRNHFQGPTTSNPKLVSYLAAGGIQGLRPMRYEKRVARNRFIALTIVLFFLLLGVLAVFLRGR